MNNIELEKIINYELKSNCFKDYAYNGLQVEGRREVKTIVSGVSICQELIDYAVRINADGIIVHHGCMWKKEKHVIRGIHRRRLKSILKNNINLYAWHLPLDVHKNFGNNVHIGKKINVNCKGNVSQFVLWGVFEKKITGKDLCLKIKKAFFRSPFYYSYKASSYINTIAWCSGKGQSFINESAEFGVDAFLTGEVSEETIHYIKEYNLHFFSIGHYASERYGIRSLGRWLQKEHFLDVQFVDVDNPV